jgi:hypothetical protein
MRMCDRLRGLFWLYALTLTVMSAQDPDSPLVKLRKLHLPESPGSVPVIYVPSAEQRALQYQKELQSAHAWFEERLGIRVPMVLSVLDQATYSVPGSGHWPMPHSNNASVPGLIVMPSRVEEISGQEPKARTPGEYITYHEAGHIFAAPLKMWSGNAFVNELVANVFAAAYIHEKRPDLSWVLEGPPRERFAAAPRYTSLADLDYIYDGVGDQNYVWFQHHLLKIAGFLTTGQKFSTVIEGLQREFPAATRKQETLEEIIVHLDRLRPGVREMLGMLAGPTTLPPLRPSACTESAADGPPLYIAVRNDTARPLAIAMPEGGSVTVAARSWRRVRIKAGASLNLPDGSCLTAGDKPALAIVEEQ